MQAAEAADRLVLVAGPGPELIGAILLLSIGFAGLAVGALLLRRGQIAALALIGLFGLVIVAAVVILAVVPARVVVDRAGIEVRIGPFHELRAWAELGDVAVRRGPFGAWLFLQDRVGDPALAATRRLPSRLRLCLGATAFEPRQIEMRIAAWRVAAAR